MKIKLVELPETFAICRFEPEVTIPLWATQGSSLFSITKTQEELSIVCEQSQIPTGVTAEKDWRAFKVAGILDFSLTGILASIATPLANQQISIFAISSFDTDFILVRSSDWSQARNALLQAGFTFETPICIG